MFIYTCNFILPPSLPPSLLPFFPPSLPPSLHPSLPSSLPLNLLPSLYCCQDVKPFGVATAMNMSGLESSSRFAPEPNTYTRAAVATIGIQHTTNGYFYHALKVRLFLVPTMTTYLITVVSVATCPLLSTVTALPEVTPTVICRKFNLLLTCS